LGPNVETAGIVRRRRRRRRRRGRRRMRMRRRGTCTNVISSRPLRLG
jgi:hypothetical protein